MKVEIDTKAALTIGGIVALLGGFYYTTKMRLDNIEQEITELHSKVDKTNKLIRKKSK